LQDALALDKIFAGRSMPAALKIAVSGCPRNCMESQSNDIGFVGTPSGYKVYVGGRGGRKQVLGQLIREGVKPEDLPALVEEIIAKYLSATKGKERISHVVEKQGVEIFK
jgi:NAD(P)H-nitrite reductase large subunit